MHILAPSTTSMLAAAAQANPSPISQTALARLSHLQSPYTTLLAPVNIPPLSPTHFYVSLPSPITHIETFEAVSFQEGEREKKKGIEGDQRREAHAGRYGCVDLQH